MVHYEIIVNLLIDRKTKFMNRLTTQEESVMIAVWKVGEGHIKSFMAQMENPGPYTTIASTVKNLEKKGYIQGVLFGNVYVYKPIIGREEYKKKFMSNVVREYFSDSYQDLVSFFVKDKKLSTAELKEIVKLIEGGPRK